LIAQLVRFGAVGAAAALTHFVVAVSAVRWGGLLPQWANVIGFAVAFIVSFLGQWRWTFRIAAAPLRRALPSFFLIAVSGFLLNALAYQLLLTYTPLRYDAALAIVLVAVAALTFVLSRAWAFRSR